MVVPLIKHLLVDLSPAFILQYNLNRFSFRFAAPRPTIPIIFLAISTNAFACTYVIAINPNPKLKRILMFFPFGSVRPFSSSFPIFYCMYEPRSPIVLSHLLHAHEKLVGFDDELWRSCLHRTRNPDDAYVTSVYSLDARSSLKGSPVPACMRRARSLTLNGRFTDLFIAFSSLLSALLFMFSVLRFPMFGLDFGFGDTVST